MKLHPAYQAIKSVADKTGIIKAFRTDLTRHDKAAIKDNPNSKFLWFLYEEGTHLLFPGEFPWDEPAKYSSSKLLESIFNSFPFAMNYTFFWDGQSLHHIAANQARKIASTNPCHWKSYLKE